MRGHVIRQLPNRYGVRAAAVVGATLLVGTVSCSSSTATNGEEKKTPTQIVADSKAALKQQKTVHLWEQQIDTRTGVKSVITVDLHYLNGTGAWGTITVVGKTLQLIRVGNDLYVKGATDLLGVSAAVAGNRYVKMSATSGKGEGFGQIASLTQTADQVLSATGTLSKAVGTGTALGTKTVVLTDTTPTGPKKLFIANTGPPLPLQLTGAGGTTTTLTFTDYGTPVTVAAPANPVTLPGT